MEDRQKIHTRRVINHALRFFIISVFIIGIHLIIGILGYHYICGFDWVDAFLDSSMIMGGMGQINPLTTDASKIFAGIYALFSGLVFIIIISILLYPVLRSSMIRLHIDNYKD